MTVDSCFLVTEDTLIVNENDPGSVIYEEQNESGEYVIQFIAKIDSENDLDEIFIKQRTYYLEHQMEKLL